MDNDDDDPCYEEEVCLNCDGDGCDECADTGFQYTQAAIDLQLEEQEK